MVSEDAARHAGIDLSRFDMHEAPVRGREEPVIVYTVPDPSTIAESITVNMHRVGISDLPIV